MRQVSRLEFELDGEKIPLLEFSLSQSIDTLCGSFEARLSVNDAAGMLANSGKIVKLRVGAIQRECILDVVAFSLPSEVTLSGRDKTSLLVDSSAPLLNFPKSQSFLSLAQKLCKPFSIQVLDPQGVGTFDVTDLSISPGDSVFEVLSGAANCGGVFLSTDNGVDLVIRSTQPLDRQRFTDASGILGLSLEKNVSEVFGVYIGIPEVTDIGKHKKSVRLKEAFGHPLKTKILSIDGTESLEKAVVLEATTRRRRSLSVDMSLPGYQVMDLGSQVDLQVRGLDMSGIVVQIEYSITPTSEQTHLRLGGL